MKVTIYTQAYNAEKYVKQCIESVLNQTFKDFEYFLVDNGSADTTRAILKAYAEKDKRIKLICLDNNTRDLRAKYRYDFQGEYYTLLDSDDWIEPDYLEKLLLIAENTGADIVNTGSVIFSEENLNLATKICDEPIFIDERAKFPNYIPLIHWYYRQNWGMLVKTSLLQNSYIPMTDDVGFSYGSDTLSAFTLLRGANKIYVDNTALHHYRIHSHSVSYKYEKNRSFSDLYLYNDLIDFCTINGSINIANKLFAQTVYLSSINDTLNVLIKADLNNNIKAAEIFTILNRDATKEALSLISTQNIGSIIGEENAASIKSISTETGVVIFGLFFRYISDGYYDYSDVYNLLRLYFPKCSCITQNGFVNLLADSLEFRKLLLLNDNTGLIISIALLINKKKFTKKYDLEQIIKSLTLDDKILHHITECGFITRNYDIYVLVVKKDFENAVNILTENLTNKQSETDENLLWLYLTLSALLNKVDEFILGKMCSASYYLRCKQYDKCRETIADLSEMGIEDNDEILRIKKILESVDE